MSLLVRLLLENRPTGFSSPGLPILVQSFRTYIKNFTEKGTAVPAVRGWQHQNRYVVFTLNAGPGALTEFDNSLILLEQQNIFGVL